MQKKLFTLIGVYEISMSWEQMSKIGKLVSLFLKRGGYFMSDNLYVRITKEKSSIQQGAYWWPLIFEAMRRASFQFYPAESLEKQGSYFSFYVEMDEVTLPFQELWDVLYAAEDLAQVFFWPAEKNVEPFSIDATVMAEANGEWQLDVTLSDGYLRSKDAAQNRYRLNALLQVGLVLFELCFPCTIQMYWDETYWNNKYTELLQMRTINQENLLEPIMFSNQLLQWKEIACIQQQHLYITDPTPIHLWGNCFRFVSLFADTAMTANFQEENEEK